jgi:hypothetical protein
VIQMNTLPTGSTRAFILFMRPNFTFPIFELGEESVVATVTFGIAEEAELSRSGGSVAGTRW